MTDKKNKILEFVKLHHANQFRKYTGEPYYTHLVNVANIVHEEAPIFLGVEIALLHDLFSSTSCTTKDLKIFLKSIGYTQGQIEIISSSVIELTDEFTVENSSLFNRKQRKLLELVRLSKISKLAQTVKYADLIDNAKSIVEHDMNFAKVYLNEKKQILKYMRDGDFELYLLACSTLYSSLIKIKIFEIFKTSKKL